MAKHNFGLANVELGTIESDGSLSLALVPVGETVIGTATMTTAAPTITDFNIEESDSPIESIVTTPGKVTFAWSSFNIEPTEMVRFFGGTATAGAAGGIATLGAITAGSAYTPGDYYNIPLTGGTGTLATADITVGADGYITKVTRIKEGTGYTAADSLSASAANIGGTGTGFAVVVATVAATGGAWAAPDTFVDNELSVQLTDKKGNIVQIPRAKLSASMAISFSKSKLGQVDIVATILQPNKAGLARIKIIYV